MNAARTYEIRTYGCQMNFHDSERLAGLLEQSGYQRAPGGEVPDVVVFNTCAVRENADNRLVHFAPSGTDPRPGDVVTTVVTQAAPHYLIADAPPRAVRRTRSGDAWQARKDGLAGPDAAGGVAGHGPSVLLGMPVVGRPAS